MSEKLERRKCIFEDIFKTFVNCQRRILALSLTECYIGHILNAIGHILIFIY